MGDREEVMCRVRTPRGLNGVVTRLRRSRRGSGSRLSRGERRRFVDAHSSRRDAVVAAAAHSSLSVVERSGSEGGSVVGGHENAAQFGRG
jgi:hypothetical protein